MGRRKVTFNTAQKIDSPPLPEFAGAPTEAAHIILIEQDWYQASEGEIDQR